MPKTQELILYTPKLIAKYPALNEPDTYKDKTEYKVRLIGDVKDPAVKKFMEEQKEAARELGFTKLGPTVNLPMKPVLDEDGMPTGKVQIILRSKYKPLFVKPSGKPFGENEEIPYIGAGSLLIGKIKVNPYEKGLASRMMAIQILKIDNQDEGKSQNSGDTGFSAAEGYSDDDIVGIPGFSDQSSDNQEDDTDDASIDI